MADKPIYRVGTSWEDLRAFPFGARPEAGFQLRRVQQGLEPNDWKPMPRVGPGVQEIRIHTRLEHRVFHIAKLREGVYVLHAFEKRTRKTSKHDVELGRRRLRDLLARRREQDATKKTKNQGPSS